MDFVKVTVHDESGLVCALNEWMLPEPKGCTNMRLSVDAVPPNAQTGRFELMYDSDGEPYLADTRHCGGL